ncbi:Acetylornithine aminotransferase, mitochondrial [Wickerhamiella sorbophila]|uniref:Acetylornithine aminotransferase, mitochondrial n=1 Tax=Wickerhamiella sorbophila TaxID=45607 RepID=A0A2T0FKT5_9ASCO|nr:Acetylornithine aminotransferase, mitochondrial [Wickerhamiella sorbophila]PRT55590.1 Acetylornithine aminotransferase, mitochondrial [Wickerhamiella sorbophila]
MLFSKARWSVLPQCVRSISSKALLNETEEFMVTTYARPPQVFVKGDGTYMWDAEGNKMLDFTAGIAVTCLGHSNKEIAKIMFEQGNTLVHSSNLYFNEYTPQLSQKIVQATKQSGAMKDASRLFVCNSGSEANEAAIKFARKYGKQVSEDKIEVLAFKGGFHGRTYGSLSATCNPKYQAPFAPMVPGFKYSSINDMVALDEITDKTCAVIVEPIQGEGGINPCSAEWLKSVRQKCDSVGALLIYDEIQCGLGRTGDLWAHKAAGPDAHPDILTMAKALGNGYPIGATMVSEKVNNVLKVGDHGTTYGGNPLGCRIGLYVLSQLTSPELMANVTKISDLIVDRANSWISKYPNLVTEVRGRGLLLGVQLSTAPDAVLAHARDSGLLVITAGTNTLRLVPALNITEEDAVKGLDILEAALEKNQ